jgi:hypothetical protein
MLNPSRPIHILYSLLLVPFITYLPVLFIEAKLNDLIAFFIGIPLTVYVVYTDSEPTIAIYSIFLSIYVVFTFIFFKLNIINRKIYIIFYIYSIIQSAFAWFLVLSKWA